MSFNVHQTSAVSWGTGRAVSRLSRVRGGTHRGLYGRTCAQGQLRLSKFKVDITQASFSAIG